MKNIGSRRMIVVYTSFCKFMFNEDKRIDKLEKELRKMKGGRSAGRGW